MRWAAARGSPFVLFLDADDLSRPCRLAAVRAAFADASAPGVVYSTFDVVDQEGRLVPLEAMTRSVAEVIEAHRRGPPQGAEVWVAIGTETGYVNHTSSTAVRCRRRARCRSKRRSGAWRREVGAISAGRAATGEAGAVARRATTSAWTGRCWRPVSTRLQAQEPAAVGSIQVSAARFSKVRLAASRDAERGHSLRPAARPTAPGALG